FCSILAVRFRPLLCWAKIIRLLSAVEECLREFAQWGFMVRGGGDRVQCGISAVYIALFGGFHVVSYTEGIVYRGNPVNLLRGPRMIGQPTLQLRPRGSVCQFQCFDQQVCFFIGQDIASLLLAELRWIAIYV